MDQFVEFKKKEILLLFHQEILFTGKWIKKLRQRQKSKLLFFFAGVFLLKKSI